MAVVAATGCNVDSVGSVYIPGKAGSGGSTSVTAGTTGITTGGVAGTSSTGRGGATGSGGQSIDGGSGVGSGGFGGGSGGGALGPGGAPGASGGSSGGGGSMGAGGTTGAGGSGTSTGAWRPFSEASPWNTPIPANPAIDADSQALIADLAGSSPAIPNLWINIQEYSIPVFWADASTARQRLDVTLLAGQGFGNGASGSALVPIPAGAAPSAGTDQHLCIVDKRSHTEWGSWDTSHPASGWTALVAATSDLSGTGVRPPKASNPTWWTSHDARACGFPLIAGLISVEEIQKGKIEHALVIAYPHVRSHWYTPPASTAQASGGQAQPTRGVPCGGRIQLDPALDVDALPLSTSGKIIARALQQYGAFVGDFAGAIALYADASPDALAAWNRGLLENAELSSIDLRRLRVLALGTMYEDTN